MRLALGISYFGLGYEGWQSQASGRTLQDRLEKALGQFAGHPVSTLCAGRTDSGVHALMQVIHLDTEVDRRESSWVRGTNRYLPRDVAVEWAREVDPTFHSRSSALYRRYSYLLRESAVRPSIDAGHVGWVFRPLQEEPLKLAAQLLVGEHDFSAFRASSCQAKSPVKTMRMVEVRHCGCYWRIDFEANAFLHHMIRNIMGCLVAVGLGTKPPEWMGELLRARDRKEAAPTFSAAGLYFLGPVYDPRWGLPSRTAAFDWLPCA